MCGRFENKEIDKELLELFAAAKLKVEVEPEINDIANEDIRPTQRIMTVILNKDVYRISKVKWGIKFSDESPLIFNSRIETIKEKKYWATLFTQNKCIVPMTGFYEWQSVGKRKQKYRIYLPDQKLFFVPAIYHIDKEKNLNASLITTVPNKFIKEIHHRMPVILDFEKAVAYLNNEPNKNLELCVPYDDKNSMEFEKAII
jgi:putative SOS response-associated peptidase YedK